MLHHQTIYTVSQLNETINELLSEFCVNVVGEVSDFKIVRNTFVYFSIKDDQSVLSCFMMLFAMKTPIEDGMEVKLNGKPGIYVPYGKYTFRVESVEPVGEGALKRTFELTRKKLAAEGLFDASFKKPLPRFPEKIGLITGDDSAAYTDVVRILKNRWSGLEILFYPVLVQGESAVSEIVSALNYFNQHEPVDVLILTRGGGSLEDLMAFNSEEICRTVFGSKIPVIAAVGHERDETLVEYVADMRGSTPSNAAEMAAPEKRHWLERLSEYQNNLNEMMRERSRTITEHIQTLGVEMTGFLENKIVQTQEKINHMIRLLKSLSPITYLKETQSLIMKTQHQLEVHVTGIFLRAVEKTTAAARILNSLNPELPLERGYSLSYQNGNLVRSLKQIKIGEKLRTKIKDGEITSLVTQKG
ncbi:MAG TPA: exodeoxyribonuclease VII large subunit [Patescibacteria group bacterium]|nr:exodeoxyribonuclease VII large subunit [Patescibacteria group bacterium]